MPNYVRIALLIALPIILTGCQPAKQTNQESNQSTPAGSTSMNTEESNTVERTFSQAPDLLPDDQIKGKDILLTTNKGEIRFKLFADEAPMTVSNFVFLASKQFYDGLTFHRVEPGFVIQGGDPEGSGRGGPGYKFADEPVKRNYTRGIVAMANSGPNTNGSQFFIMLGDTPLPPAYTIFGEVVSGIEVVDQIRVGDTMTTVTVLASE